MSSLRAGLVSLVRWFDADYGNEVVAARGSTPDRVEWVRCLPFVFLHLGCLGVLWVGWSWTSVAVAVALYFVRMFAITGFYHRYFSHRSFQTSRVLQFLFGLVGATAVQRGPLWWAHHHRHHHQHSDAEHDRHSPRQHGFWWAHMGWITSGRNFPTDYSRIKDFARFPELVFLNRFDIIVPTVFAFALLGLGRWLESAHPALGVTGMQLVVWGFFISTTVLFHCTCFINSLAHVFGRQRYPSDDDSRNSLLLALLTLGEGWHNNHHHYMHSTRQGFYWWEIDLTYYGLKVLSWTGLIWNLRPVPVEVLSEGRSSRAALPGA